MILVPEKHPLFTEPFHQDSIQNYANECAENPDKEQQNGYQGSANGYSSAASPNIKHPDPDG